jgi:hypothetical protein
MSTYCEFTFIPTGSEGNGTYTYNWSVVDGDPIAGSTTTQTVVAKCSNILQVNVMDSNGCSYTTIVSSTASYATQSNNIVSDQSISFDIINQTTTGGDINIDSDFNIVGLNGITFSNKFDLSFQDLNNKALTYKNGSFVWDEISFNSPSGIGNVNSYINISGNPLLINDYPLELTDNRPISTTFSEIGIGVTFNQTPIVEVLKRMIYTYLKPECSIEILPPYSSGYVEVGTNPSIILSYSITKKTLDTNTATLINMLPSSHPVISGQGHITVYGTASGVFAKPVELKQTSFTISVYDATNNGSSASTSITGIYPYFYGVSTSSSINSYWLSLLNKLIEPKTNKTFVFDGQGFIYFIYDSSYGTLSSILQNGVNVTNSFTHSVVNFALGWQSKSFIVYKQTISTQFSNENFHFMY